MKIEKYFFVSLVLHLLLGMSFLSIQLFSKGSVSESLRAIASYTYQLPAQSSMQHAVTHHSQSEILKQASHAISIEKRKIETPASNRVKQEKSEAASPAQGSEHDAVILKILHQAIFAKQTYPESALLLHQTGTVTLGMRVAVTGDISHITIVKSSGFASIDEAAKEALLSSSPVIAIRPYLHEAQDFSIAVVFE